MTHAKAVTESQEATIESAAESAAETERARSGMVVGIDGSPDSNHALAWAAERTERFGRIRPVATWQYPWWAISVSMPLATVPAYDDLAALASAHAEDTVSAVPESVRDQLIVVQAAPGPTLVEEGSKAALIVVGTRGRGAIADTLLGSVSCHVVSHSTVPVAVVPIDAPLDDRHQRIVVGVDGSENSIRALAWAARTAAEGQAVEAILTWSYLGATFPEAAVLAVEQFEAAADETLSKTIMRVEEIVGKGCREIVPRVIEGDPRSVLRSEALSADLLVLGARGHQGFTHAVLGSVTTGLIHQPVATTIVVPSPH